MNKKSKTNNFLQKVGKLLRGNSKKNTAMKAKIVKKASKSIKAKAIRKIKVKAKIKTAKQRMKHAVKVRIMHRKHAAARRHAHIRVVKTVSVQVRPIVKKEIMMPEPWSRVEKFKKVKKENDWGYGGTSP